MRAWLGRLGLVVASCAVTLGVVEIALYLVPAWSRATTRGERFAFSPYRSDGELGFTLRPGVRVRHADRDFSVSVVVNSLGMRGPERGTSKPAGTTRILLLGDSFAFGWGVEQEEAFAARLERLLTERVGPVEVLPAAVPGWSTDQHFIYLHTRGLALRPDLILLATSENDLTELSLNRLTLGDERLPVRVEPMWRMIDATGRMRYMEQGARPSRARPGRGRHGSRTTLSSTIGCASGWRRPRPRWPSGGRAPRRPSGSPATPTWRSTACLRTISSARWP